MNSFDVCLLSLNLVLIVVWLYLAVTGALGAARGLRLTGEDAPRRDAWILFGLSYAGLFFGPMPVLAAAVMRGRVWPRVNFDDDTIGSVLLDDTTGNLITVQMFGLLLGVMFVVAVVGLLVVGSLS